MAWEQYLQKSRDISTSVHSHIGSKLEVNPMASADRIDPKWNECHVSANTHLFTGRRRRDFLTATEKRNAEDKDPSDEGFKSSLSNSGRYGTISTPVSFANIIKPRFKEKVWIYHQKWEGGAHARGSDPKRHQVTHGNSEEAAESPRRRKAMFEKLKVQKAPTTWWGD